ncbi:MAG TPA: hypothetical protein VG015_00280, partial [Candidatus Dormibacteraeota bacterium]|nr:hypothetical protein [Candidatus Dormibacteraeota bacterium]
MAQHNTGERGLSQITRICARPLGILITAVLYLASNPAVVHATGLPPATAIETTARVVADHWIASHPAASTPNDWINSVFLDGDLAFYNRAQDSRYLNFANQWALANHYSLRPPQPPLLDNEA